MNYRIIASPNKSRNIQPPGSEVLLITLRAELHSHTVLSPCADLEMLPALIIAECVARDIGLLAITDHNSSANISAVQKAALGSGVTVLPGMELQTREGVHALCLFDTLEQIFAWQIIVDRAMPECRNPSTYMGDQLLVNANGDMIGREERPLIVSTDITLEQAWRQVTDLAGMLIPAHVNRSANGMLPIMGEIPSGIPFSALEISHHMRPSAAVRAYPALDSFTLLQGGDAHRLDDLIGANQFTLESPTIEEMNKALHNVDGRSLISILPV